MNVKTILILIGLFLVLVVGTFVATNQERNNHSPRGQLVFPELRDQVNSITEIEIIGKNGKVTVVREGPAWKVQNKSGYPADLGQVRKAILGLAELRYLEAKTQNPDLYEKLGLQDVETEGSLSTRVHLIGENKKTLADLIVGNRRPSKADPQKEDVYIRLPDDSQTWLAVGHVLVERLPEDWVDKTLLDVAPNRIHRVILVHPEHKTLTLVKEQPGDSDFTIVNMPKNMKVKSQFTVNNIASTLGSLSLENVMPASEQNLEPSAAVKAVLETFDGLEATVFLQKKANNIYASVSSRFDQGLLQQLEAKEKEPKEEAVDSDKKSESAEPESPTPKLKAPEEVQREAEDINQRTGNWIFTIPKFRADNIVKTLNDLVEKKP